MKGAPPWNHTLNGRLREFVVCLTASMRRSPCCFSIVVRVRAGRPSRDGRAVP